MAEPAAICHAGLKKQWGLRGQAEVSFETRSGVAQGLLFFEGDLCSRMLLENAGKLVKHVRERPSVTMAGRLKHKQVQSQLRIKTVASF